MISVVCDVAFARLAGRGSVRGMSVYLRNPVVLYIFIRISVVPQMSIRISIVLLVPQMFH